MALTALQATNGMESRASLRRAHWLTRTVAVAVSHITDAKSAHKKDNIQHFLKNVGFISAPHSFYHA